MIEGFAIVFVVVVSLGIYLSAWIAARNTSNRNLPGELAELKQHRETLLQKEIRGKEEHWDSVMMSQLAHRLDQVEQQIAQETSQA